MEADQAGVNPYRRSAVLMDMLVSIEVASLPPGDASPGRVERALQWFERVEACCSRFDPDTEVMRLAHQPGTPVPVSPMLYHMVEFALAVARATDGAFDPTVGYALEQRGFSRDYRSGNTIVSALSDSPVSYRDVLLDRRQHTILLRQPLILDLGAVAKGFAIDLAAQELGPLGKLCRLRRRRPVRARHERRRRAVGYRHPAPNPV